MLVGQLPGIDGFLGTRGSLMLDIVFLAMFAVVSRRRDAGILFSLGAQRREVAAAFTAELLLLGASGGAAGALMGWALSRGLTALVGDVISNLYFFLRPTPPAWSWEVAGRDCVRLHLRDGR